MPHRPSHTKPLSSASTEASDRHADLRQRLIEAAAAEIAEKGLSGLKAREVTRRAGCALGALYTGFADLDDLVLHVNLRSLGLLGEALKAALPATGASPEDISQALARAYVAFALDQPQLWAALFPQNRPTPPPDWYRREHDQLIARLITPLGRLRPDLPPERMLLRIRTLFGAVHGVVQLSQQNQLVGVPREMLYEEVAALVTAMTLGARSACRR